MSKPLIANRERQSEATRFHREVFLTFGGPTKICSLCGKPGATDAAHVIPRAHLGKLRYASVFFARPAHRHCHEAQHRGETDFSLQIRRNAISVHNAMAKVPMVLP
jgi:hypothetical protein